jgi:hypothetical protein
MSDNPRASAAPPPATARKAWHAPTIDDAPVKVTAKPSSNYGESYSYALNS